jgi:hypothetical protein
MPFKANADRRPTSRMGKDVIMRDMGCTAGRGLAVLSPAM